MFLQPFRGADKDNTFVAQRFFHVGVHGFRIKLGFDSGEEFAFLLRNTEALESAFDVVWNFIPRAGRALGVGEVITDIVEDDIFQVPARPVGWHGFGEKHVERFVAKLTNPVGLLFYIDDVIHRRMSESRARIEGVLFGVGKIAPRAVDVDLRDDFCRHKFC